MGDCPRIREEVLRDASYPVHRIADKLLPFLRVLVEQFHPEQVILFSSFAYGSPGQDSDVDLLVVKAIDRSQAADATVRQEIEKFARIIFSSSPAQREFWNGQRGVTIEDLRARYDGCKPCLHGGALR